MSFHDEHEFTVRDDGDAILGEGDDEGQVAQAAVAIITDGDGPTRLTIFLGERALQRVFTTPDDTLAWEPVA